MEKLAPVPNRQLGGNNESPNIILGTCLFFFIYWV